jgi:site-specific DNA-cytosine methylase
MVVRSGCDADANGRSAGKGALIQTERASTINTVQDQYLFQPKTFDARGNGDGSIVATLTGDHQNRVTDYTSVVCEPVGFDSYNLCLTGSIGRTVTTPSGGLNEHIPIVVEPICYIVRRLTPTECARLQGFADWWGHIEHKKDFTDEELSFWLDVRNTHAAINGKAVKDYNKTQMLTWYNKLWSDGAEYKMWGNGIALPPALYCMQGIADVLNREEDDSWML